jgi:uncharacterized protein YjbJ (UPF0337 family)
MNWTRIQGRYYQIAGRVREHLGTLVKNETEVRLGKEDQLVGRLREYCGVSLEDAELLASQVLCCVSHH